MLGVGRGGPLGPVGGGAPELTPASPPAVAREAVAAGTTRRRQRASGLLSEQEAWAALAAVEGLGPVTFGVLLRAFGSVRAVLATAERPSGPARLVAAAAGQGLRLTPDVARAVGDARSASPSLQARLASLGVFTVTADDEGYPPRLRAIEVPPPVLFVRGELAALDAERAVALVGTRHPSDDGRRVATRLGGTLAAAAATVISGLAVGIDGAAHAGALRAGGLTVAVLGSGHARLYPAVHAHLAAEIVRAGGAVVAELPPDAAPTPAGFPRRNRIIAALADATVVVEAGERSGALITASWALEQGRAVFAVPGPIDRPQSTGCNRLLRTQAGDVRIVAGPDELLEDLGYAVDLPVRRARRGRSETVPPDAGAILVRLGPAEAAAVRCILGGPQTADAIAVAADLAPATVLAVLTRLEEQGLVAGVLGRYRAAGPLAGVHLGQERGHREGRDP
jgi:DNA processing protein